MKKITQFNITDIGVVHLLFEDGTMAEYEMVREADYVRLVKIADLRLEE